MQIREIRASTAISLRSYLQAVTSCVVVVVVVWLLFVVVVCFVVVCCCLFVLLLFVVVCFVVVCCSSHAWKNPQPKKKRRVLLENTGQYLHRLVPNVICCP